MLISDIFPTQNGLRNMERTNGMMRFVKDGGIFTPKAIEEYCLKTGCDCKRPIVIVEFEDGQKFIRDGHHRCYSIWHYREHLETSEYVVDKFRYKDFTEINLNTGWVTPFHPLVEVRKADFSEFKRHMPNNRIEAIKYIMDAWHKGIYSMPRNGLDHISKLETGR